MPPRENKAALTKKALAEYETRFKACKRPRKPSGPANQATVGSFSTSTMPLRARSRLEDPKLWRVMPLRPFAQSCWTFHAVRSRCAWAWWYAKKADEELAEKRRVEEEAMSKVDR